MDTVSVIIPVYNARRYVERCVRSVLDQSYRDLEILIIDDGSTDGSSEILDRLAEMDTRIILIHQENQGVAAARNRAADMARGSFLTFVDGDDYISRNYIRRFLRKQRATDADLVICGLDFVDEDGHVLRRVIPGRYERFEHEEWPMLISAVCSHFYRRELWHSSRIRFVPGERGEDMPVSLYFSAVCEKITTLPASGYFYVQHDSSAMHRFRGLKDYRLPYTALEETLIQVRQEGLKNDREFYEVFILRILATCLFSLARGASAARKKELCDYIQLILKEYLPDYRKNRKTSLFSGLEYPLFQKAAVSALILLARTNLLYPVSLLLI